MIVDGRSPAAIAQAVAALAAGELVGMPTETVYGLAADAGNDAAVARIFSAKGRPGDHPLIVHVADASAVSEFAADVPAFAGKLIAAFWPGPLTLILPRRADRGTVAAAGQGTVGLRCPSHPVAQALLQACAAAPKRIAGLAAPSANRFGRVSPTTAQHVRAEFGEALLILDGGPCQVGIESSIVDCTRGAPVLLRPGVLTSDQLASAAGQPLRMPQDLDAPAPRASGTLESHYAPRAKLRIMDLGPIQAALDVLGADAPKLGAWTRGPLRSPSARVLCRHMPARAADAARDLFAVLREFDDQGVELIWVESPPDEPQWDGVRDRLQRAAVR
jgi:L-threonylcarbamoyladenylate synthase